MAVKCEEFLQSLDTDSRTQLDQLARHTLNCEMCHNLWRAHQRLALSARAPDTLSMSTDLEHALSGHSGPTHSSTRLRRSALVVIPLGLLLACAWLGLARPDLRDATTLPFWSGAALLGLCFSICLGVHVRRDLAGFSASPSLRWACALGMLGVFPLFASLPSLHGPHDPSLALPRDCLLFGLAISLALSACAFGAVRRSVLIAPSASGALAGCIGGIGGLLWLHLHCAAGAGKHVLVVHGLAFGVTLMAATLLGRRWALHA